MVFYEASVGLVRGRTDAQFGVVLQPGVQPLADSVLASFAWVQSRAILDCLFELPFDLCLSMI